MSTLNILTNIQEAYQYY